MNRRARRTVLLAQPGYGEMQATHRPKAGAGKEMKGYEELPQLKAKIVIQEIKVTRSLRM